ncbi:hypothetical protein DFH06DRAFT_1466446 [Mycena polygramma]|nr:hypothetical protein DFH06DRAFT_1466446 [Mycena polygramma]
MLVWFVDRRERQTHGTRVSPVSGVSARSFSACSFAQHPWPRSPHPTRLAGRCAECLHACTPLLPSYPVPCTRAFPSEAAGLARARSSLPRPGGATVDGYSAEIFSSSLPAKCATPARARHCCPFAPASVVWYQCYTCGSVAGSCSSCPPRGPVDNGEEVARQRRERQRWESRQRSVG